MIKKRLSGIIIEGKDDWVPLIDQIVDGMNEAPSSAIQGKAPEDVRDDELAVFDLQKQNALLAKESQDKQMKQKRKIETAGAVRQMIDNQTSEEPRFGFGRGADLFCRRSLGKSSSLSRKMGPWCFTSRRPSQAPRDP